MPTLAIGIPAYGGRVDVGHIPQAGALGAALAKAGGRTLFLFTNSSSLDFARNYLCYQAVDQGADWLLMIDADTFVARAEPVLEMLVAGAQRDAAVIAAPVLTRKDTGGTYNAVVVENGLERNLVREDFEGRVVKVDRIGTAFMAVRCGFLRQVPAPWFQSEQVIHEGRPAWRGEDFLFCDKIREAGGDIYCDGRFEPVHRGTVNESALMKEMGFIAA